MCGANIAMIPPCSNWCGSSPRVRGEPEQADMAAITLRIIPACAGRTSPAPARTSSRSDHPRVCGANFCTNWVPASMAGSSPRVRGELLPEFLDAVGDRIIPACAGRTAADGYHAAGDTDHPRVCGANPDVCCGHGFSSGSSPRVRGEHGLGVVLEDDGRIIPACAGRTGTHGKPPATRPDHPRVCGANRLRLPVVVRVPGSSPRVRGEPEAERLERERERIIPACAGRTPRSRAV